MSDYELLHAYETVNLQRAGGAARIELNRPERMNAWEATLTRDLRAALERVAEDDSLRAVLLTGAGRGFCSGADLSAGFDPRPDGKPDLQTSLRERYHPVITTIRELPKPVVAAVNGGAVGVGCSLALACDLILAAESAYFLLAFVNIGLVPDGGSSAFIPARVGLTRAIEMAMLGERIHGPKALEWGLVNAVHPDDELQGAADALVARLAAGPTLLLRRRQAPVQRVGLRDARGPARARGGDPAGAGAHAGLHRGRHRLPAEAPGRLRGPLMPGLAHRVTPLARHSAAP